ncbi:hypothetical protein [Dietzia lutea]|uniref:hypothetical protein n=1 Tax=Dietzia lutea TaxID=546160 RepID=UPI00132F6C21|nr:hypothetical protein [Dietzia lutea]
MSNDRINPDELAHEYSVGIDHHSKLGEPLTSALADQLAAPSYSPGFRRMEWFAWFAGVARAGGLGARVSPPPGEFVPDWNARDSLAVQSLLAESAEGTRRSLACWFTVRM